MPSFTKDESLDSKMGEPEIRKALCFLFNGVSRILGDKPPPFEDKDFQPEAEGVISLVNHVSQARILLRLIGPIVAIVGIIEKVQLIIQRLNERKAAKTDTGEVQQETENIVDISQRPAFR